MNPATDGNAYLDIDDLSIVLKHLPSQRLLRSVGLHVKPGEVRGLVGESGAGKSMIGKTIFDILPRAVEIVEGKVTLGGEDLLALPESARRRVIARTSALIPQDPLTALNPVRRIESQITDRLTKILGFSKADARERARTLLDEVHIRDPERVLKAYPHQLSGGMRQRVLIAAAFAAEPKLIVADEPTTALDVTVQKQILRLIAEMQARHQTALLFVTHDLGVVAKICQNVTVLYGGMVVEDTDVKALFANPRHAYTRALIAATPRYDCPEESLVPVPVAVIEATRAEIAAADTAWRAGR
ncbi:ABC transporter ATP-binding protein [Microbaculum marinisediminis]|uniref:ABC transporter ATP-binding protein n=1 Tax=Microbaculum marinisediminis TaxID=2931392 RepID=A0AAW5R2B7_9HYPH|nr:ABC transporter ATP-binding protein [Microbaculum sp. A6E488]MCT8972754.1 ABC transporter ATP-binding protein [Microbaculum sp. A6E488]